MLQVRSLKKELEVLKEEQAAAADTMSQEATAKMVEENKRLQDECDQERMAYQKLLKGYNRLEVQLENAQDELNAAVNGGAGGQGLATNSNFFLFPICKKSLICPSGTVIGKSLLFSFIPPSNSLVSVSDP